MANKIKVGFISQLPRHRAIVSFDSNVDLKVGDTLVLKRNPATIWRVLGQNFARSPSAKKSYIITLDRGTAEIHCGEELLAN